MDWNKNFLLFNRKERRGLFLLLLIVVIVWGINFFLPSKPGQTMDKDPEFFSEMERFLAKHDSIQLVLQEAQAAKRNFTKDYTYRVFDPNQVSLDSLLDMGIPANIAYNLVKYREKGGVYYRPSDLRKIYGMNAQLFDRLVPYIRINRSRPASSQAKLLDKTKPIKRQPIVKKRKKRPFNPVNINRADSLELLTIYGVGPVFARRIVKYREQLGGFNSCDQLLEVYGFDSLRFRQVRPQVYADSIQLQVIPINSATFKQLLRHPYLDFEAVKALVNYRENYGPFDSVGQIRELHLLNGVNYQKIEPYLVL